MRRAGGDSQCKTRGFYGLASIHSRDDINLAAAACKEAASQHVSVSGLPHGCWIGLTSLAQQDSMTFSWMDGTAVEYLNWSPGEPNNLGAFEQLGDVSAEQPFQ